MLCESAASVGSDFVSLDEQTFCDMEHKKMWQLCDAKKTHGCFNTASNKIIAGNGAGTGTAYGVGKTVVNDALAVAKPYSKTIHWT